MRQGALLLISICVVLALPNPGIGIGQAIGAPPLANTLPPITNLVPDEDTAVAIAIAVLTPIYGSQIIRFETPFHAALKGDVWTVHGSLPDGYLGGVSHVRIARQNARVLKIWHTQ